MAMSRAEPAVGQAETSLPELAEWVGEIAVGVDKEHDQARGFVVSADGITVVGKGQVVAP
jgi:hypothetical protein